MLSFLDALKVTAKRLTIQQMSLLDFTGNRSGRGRRFQRSPFSSCVSLEALEQRKLLTTSAVSDGDWFDDATWDNGVPDDSQRAIIGHGVTVELDGTDHFAQELVIHGDLVVPEENSDPTAVVDGRLKLYVNGSLAGEAEGSQLWDHSDMAGVGGITSQTRTHEGIRLTGNHSGDFFNGAIDKVATHNRALSNAEIETLFNSDRQQNEGVPQQGIAALWLFDEVGQDGSDVAVGDVRSDDGDLKGDANTDGALQLDGSGDYVKVGRSTDLNRGVFTEKTVSLWFKADDTDGVQMIYEQGGGTRGLNIYLDGDTLYAGGWNLPNRESDWNGDWITQTGIVAGEWNHVVLTLDANAGADVDKSLTTRWIHVNSGGQFTVGSEADRYNDGTFTLNLTGTDVSADHVIETNMMGVNPGTMNVANNDGFLMTAMGGSVHFYGQDKLSFTKLSATAVAGDTTITVENTIERNYNKGAMNGDNFVTSASDDGIVNWEVGDQIVIASSSYDYTEEDVRTITAIINNGDGTSSVSLDSALQYRHYGEIETYGETAAEGTTVASETRSIDLRAEVALLSRNVKVQGLASQDTDANFGDRANADLKDRVRAGGLSDAEWRSLPASQVANGVGAHIMIMPNSGEIVVDGVQLNGMGQASQKGRYPIHWHLGDDRSGDVLKNTSITNSNNRGVTIHGTSNLQIEGVTLHDIHGHGFFFEDAVETGNELIGNIALGIHTVGGNDRNFANPGGKDAFVVDTHDSVLETGSRFSSSAAFWITNPTNTFVGNISAGAGDRRTDDFANPEGGVSGGTGFWFALPRTALGSSGQKEQYQDVQPIFAEFGQFDYNTSHTTAVGLNFDRGSDIEDAHFNFDDVDFNAIQPSNEYAPRTGSVKSGESTTNVVKGFTNYKATDAAFYHRGDGETILLDGLKVADSYNGPWAVSENKYDNSLFVGHSKDNHDLTAEVGGPRLYDGAGLYTNTHFAGFGGHNAYAFQVEGSSFGPTMYHAFRGTSFEADGTYDNITHAVSDFTQNSDGHNLGQPSQWIKAVIDLDGTLTGGAEGGVGYSIVPNVDFLVDGDDFQPEGWDAWVTDDVYARMRIQNKNDGVALFPSGETGEPLVRFTARDGDVIDVMGGQSIAETLYWTQISAKAESDGFVDGTLTIEFMRNGVPTDGFVLNMDNQDGDRPDLSAEIQTKVDAARLVSKFVGIGNYTPSIGVEVSSEDQLRSVTDDVAYFRDGLGNLYLNTSIVKQPYIEMVPGEVLQTAFIDRTIAFGTTIEAEEFDNGIDGIAYHDSDSTNSQGAFRAETGVDSTATAVSDITDGEWLEYTADILGRAFNVGINVSSTAVGGEIKVLAANSNSAGFLRELGTIEVPDTGGEFSTQWLEGVDLAFAEGPDSVIRLEFDGGGFEVDSLEFAEPTQTAYVDRAITADLTTTRVELEEFDLGGQGVAYFDDSAGNLSSSDFRIDEDVDTVASQLEGRVFEGEWLEYTTDIQAGVYDITLRKSWGGDDSGVKLLIADSNAATETEFTELGEFSFADGELITLEGIDLSSWAGGNRVIRIEIVGNWMGIDYLDFAHTGSVQTAFVDRAITSTGTTRIELEHYDVGGQGVAYSDTTAGNGAGDFRANEGVDTNGDILTNDVFDGEWLEYTTDIEEGVYDITLRRAWSAGDAGVKISIANSNSATEFTELGQFAFGAAATDELITLSSIDLSSWVGVNQLIRIEIIGNWMGLDYLDFSPAL